MVDTHPDSYLFHNYPSTIQEGFDGKCVFITGVTGFLGKVLLEKILRSCQSVACTLVLIRRNENHTSAERLEKLLADGAFDRIRCECEEVLQKVIAVDGDVKAVNFALSAEDRAKIEKVDYVFHCAASVRFVNDPRSTLMINFIGVKNLVVLCKSLKKLQAVVHVSTAYSFCNQPLIYEHCYRESVEPEQLERYIHLENDVHFERRCLEFSRSRPSLYQYSKAMAEIYIANNCENLPIIIVRPSIITAAIKEPFPGWIDNYNGPSGFIALSCRGAIKTLLVRPNVTADWVPVDLVANTLIAAAHYVATKNHVEPVPSIRKLTEESNVPIINCVCPLTNSIKWSEVTRKCIPLLSLYPSLKTYREPGGVVTSCFVVHGFCRYFYHYLPAAILDAGLFLMCRKRIYVDNYRRIHKVLDYMQHYTIHRFQFVCRNMAVLTESMSSQDRRIFPIDQSSLDWDQYLEDYVHGVRLYYLKEEDSTLEYAQIRLRRLRYLYNGGKLAALGLVLLLLVKNKRFQAAPSSLLNILKNAVFEGFEQVKSLPRWISSSPQPLRSVNKIKLCVMDF